MAFGKASTAGEVEGAGSGSALSTRDLSLEVSGRRLIDKLTLSLPPTSITIVMGPNGAGKSQFLRLLHGLAVPTSGTVFCCGTPLSERHRARQAMVFQKPVLLRRSVAANIDYALAVNGRRSRRRRELLLEAIGFTDKASQPARLLSGGEQQRLALARALATEPDTLFLDEPTASLDPASAQTIEHIVRDVSAQGTKIVFVTHDIGQAKRLAGDVVFLHRGKLAEHSPAPRFFARPRSEAARAFLAGQIVI